MPEYRKAVNTFMISILNGERCWQIRIVDQLLEFSSAVAEKFWNFLTAEEVGVYTKVWILAAQN